MKTRRWLYFAAFIAVIACSSCNKNKLEQTKHIPKDANIVLGVQADALYSKLKDHKDLLDTAAQFFAEQMTNALNLSDTNKQNMDALLNSIDTKQPVFLFKQTKHSIEEGEATLAGIVISLSDASKFADYVKNNLSEAVSQGNGYSFGMLKNASGSIVGWNREAAIFLNYSGDISKVPAQLDTLFNMKKSESLAADTSFASTYNAQADISFYLSSSQLLIAALPSIAMSLTMTKLDDLMKGSYTVGSINFNNGAIDMAAKNYPNAALQDLVNKNPCKALDGNTLNNYSGALQGIMDFSINPQLLAGIIQYMGFDQMINSFLQQQGLHLTLDDIAAVFKGEFAAGVSNFSNGSNGFLICAPLAGKAAYDKVINALAENNPDLFVKKNGQFIPSLFANEQSNLSLFMQSSSSITYSADNNNMLIASSQEMIDSFAAGKGSAILPDDAVKNLKGKSVYFYGNLQSISGYISGNIPADDVNSKYSETLAIVKKALKDFSAWSNVPAGNVYTGEAHIRFMDEQQNSLVSLLTMIKDYKAVQDKYDLIINRMLQMDTHLPPPAGVLHK